MGRTPHPANHEETKMKNIDRRMNQTAAEMYAERQKDIGALMDLIGQEMKAHAEKAAKDPKNWGYAGDLGRIREVMKEALMSLLLDRFVSEKLAEKFIEEHLDEMRSKPVLYRHKGKLVTVPED